MQALRRQARREPSWERMCRVRWIVLCGKREVRRVEAKAVEIVVCISVVRLDCFVSTCGGVLDGRGGEGGKKGVLVSACAPFSLHSAEAGDVDVDLDLCFRTPSSAAGATAFTPFLGPGDGAHDLCVSHF